MTIFSLISYFSTAILQNYINKIHQDMNAPCSKVGRLSLSCKMLFISRKSILLRCSLIWSSTRRNPAKYKTSATAPKIVPTEGTDSRAGISEREKTSKGLALALGFNLQGHHCRTETVTTDQMTDISCSIQDLIPRRAHICWIHFSRH